MVHGAMFLMLTTVLVHLINIFYKIPVTNIIGEVGRGYYTAAFEIYTPIYAISTGGLPVAVSKMISERIARGRYREVYTIKKASLKIFSITGITCTALHIALAYPFSHFVIGSPNTFYSILCIAPSILICALTSMYAGFFEGTRNMSPVGISQVCESVGKLLFGVLLSKLVLTRAYSQFTSTGVVFGTPCETREKAMLLAAPYSAAAAISGVTIGTLLGMLYLFIKYRTSRKQIITRDDLINAPKSHSPKYISKELIRTVVPIATSSLVLNITNFIDTITVQNRLKHAVSVGADTIREVYPQISQMNIEDKDIKDFLYGCYGVGLDFRNIIPSVILALGISVIPVLSAAYAIKDRKRMKSAVNTVIKTATLIGVPAGVCMAVLSEPILHMMYPRSSSIAISAPFVAVFGYAALLLAISTPINNMLQSIGRADVPVKSLLIGATVKIICNFILVGIPSVNIKGAPIGTILCYLIIVFNNLRVLIKETQIKINWFDSFLRPAFVGAFAGAFSFFVYTLCNTYIVFGEETSRFNGSTLSCLIALIFAIIIWALLLLIFKVLSKNDILMLPKGKKIAKVLEKIKLIG